MLGDSGIGSDVSRDRWWRGQGGARAASRWWALVIASAHGQVVGMRRMWRRAVRTIRPATARMRSRSRFGSATRSPPCRARRSVRASRSAASAAMASQIRLVARRGRAGCAARCLWPRGCGPRRGRGGGGVAPGRRAGGRPPAGVGEEPGDPHAVGVGDAQLRARVGAFLAQDQPGAGRPGRQVDETGGLGDPGARRGARSARRHRRRGACGPA